MNTGARRYCRWAALHPVAASCWKSVSMIGRRALSPHGDRQAFEVVLNTRQSTDFHAASKSLCARAFQLSNTIASVRQCISSRVPECSHQVTAGSKLACANTPAPARDEVKLHMCAWVTCLRLCWCPPLCGCVRSCVCVCVKILRILDRTCAPHSIALEHGNREMGFET